MSGPSEIWTAGEEAELIGRWNADELIKTIAGGMGRSERAIAERIDLLRAEGRVGYRRPCWTAAEDGELLAAAERGIASYRELARRFGRSRDAVKQRVYLLRRQREVQLSMELRAA